MSLAALARLRAAGLRPTSARIGVYQAIASMGTEGITVHTVFQSMAGSGRRASISSVYRIMREFSQHRLVTAALAADRTAVYFLKADEPAPATICLECGKSGRLVVIEDADLHARLIALASQQNMVLGELPILVRF